MCWRSEARRHVVRITPISQSCCLIEAFWARFHGTEEVTQGGRYIISMDQDQKLYYLARLEINNVQNSDRGEYRAVAKNKYGVGTSTINLNFEGSGKPKYDRRGLARVFSKP